MTRIYRAPEVALLQKNYDTGVDIWSIGCVLAELMSIASTKVEAIDIKNESKDTRKKSLIDILNKRYLFIGDSCFPLSPVGKEGDVSELDQLMIIMNKSINFDDKVEL